MFVLGDIIHMTKRSLDIANRAKIRAENATRDTFKVNTNSSKKLATLHERASAFHFMASMKYFKIKDMINYKYHNQHQKSHTQLKETYERSY